MMPAYPWDELAALWDRGDFGCVHDWLGERWNALSQEREAGHADADVAFLQGLAFAALAHYFARVGNMEGASLLAADARSVLSRYLPSHAGIEVAGVLEDINALRARLDARGSEASRSVPTRAFPAPRPVEVAA